MRPIQHASQQPVPTLPKTDSIIGGLSAQDLVRRGLSAGLAVGDLLVGTGGSAPASDQGSLYANIKRNGVLAYGAGTISSGLSFYWTSVATFSEMFAPGKIMMSPVQWTTQLLDPAEWASAAQLGAQTWGSWASLPMRVSSAALLGAARDQLSRLRGLATQVVDEVGSLEEQLNENIANANAAAEKASTVPAVSAENAASVDSRADTAPSEDDAASAISADSSDSARSMDSASSAASANSADKSDAGNNAQVAVGNKAPEPSGTELDDELMRGLGPIFARSAAAADVSK